MRALGIYVNSLLDSGRKIYVSESSVPSVTVDKLTEDDAKGLVAELNSIGLLYSIKDSVEQDLHEDEFDDRLAPFTVVFQKPSADPGIGFVTNRSFSEWMKSPSSVGIVRVACATKCFSTESFVVTPWEEDIQGYTADSRKSPTRLVRADGGDAVVPQDIRPYLLVENDFDAVSWEDPIFIIWLSAALRALPSCLASDVFSASGEIEFRGKPRLRLKNNMEDFSGKLTLAGFKNLQSAARWVYDVERESELRHSLLTQEVSRLVPLPLEENLLTAVEKHLGVALEGARIAYEFGLQEMSKDALKGLSELRKAIVDETQKTLDSTRQLLLGVAGATFYALGLIAARMVSKVEPWLINAMAVVGFLYVISVILVNSRALNQQRDMRGQWRNKLYRYLTSDEYLQLVDAPVQRSETIFETAMWAALFFSTTSFGLVIYLNS